MFIRDQGEWWYMCDMCKKESEKKLLRDPYAGLGHWTVIGYADVHCCPQCQSEGKVSE